MTDMPPTDVLLATTVHWASTTRLALALAEAGLRVAAVAPAQHALHRMNAIEETRVCIPHSGFMNATAKAIDELRPAMVVPGDDRAARGLYALHARVNGYGGRDRRIAATIRRSLGDPSSFPVLARKSLFSAFCTSEGLPMPETVTVSERNQFQALLARATLPRVIKLDGRWSGRGVHIVHTDAEATRGFDDFMAWRGWPSAIRRALEELSPAPLSAQFRGDAPTISMQRYISGRPANRAVFCREGRVLAGITVVAEQLGEETGPATVVRIVENAEIAALTARVVRRLGLSGFVGVDLMLEAGSGKPWIIELNPRPTQICHFAFDQLTDMVGALARTLRGTTRRSLPRYTACDGRMIALYPGEAWRDPASPYLTAAHHDIPLHEPEFVAAYTRPVADDPPSWLQTLGRSQPFRTLIRSARRRLAVTDDVVAASARTIVPAAPPKIAGNG